MNAFALSFLPASSIPAMLAALPSSLVFGQAAWDMAYAVPLILAIAFVYSATRDERAGVIINRGVRLSAMLAGFMLLVFGVLAALSWAV
ncbi:MAG TPA: hypothetical protein VGE52_20820 [Pirellulales bacterium]